MSTGTQRLTGVYSLLVQKKTKKSLLNYKY